MKLILIFTYNKNKPIIIKNVFKQKMSAEFICNESNVNKKLRKIFFLNIFNIKNNDKLFSCKTKQFFMLSNIFQTIFPDYVC